MGPPGAPAWWGLGGFVGSPRQRRRRGGPVGMGFREVSVIEVREVLRGWLEGAGLRTVAERAGVDRKTARRYVQAAQEAGLERSAGWARHARAGTVLPGRCCSRTRSRSAPGWPGTARTPSRCRSSRSRSSWPARASWWPTGRCTGSPPSGAATGPGRPRSAWTTASRAWSCRSTSATWATWSTRPTGGAARCTR